MRSFIYYLLITSVIFAFPVQAQTSQNTDNDAIADSSFIEEGLTQTDTVTDLEAETLPTINQFGYLWEQFRGAAVTVFTFNAEKKAAQYRLRLHNLDRKLTACSEIGDPECLEKVKERMRRLSDRTERYIAKREELKEKFLTRFQNWRSVRESRIEALEQTAERNRDRKAELIQQRNTRRSQAIKNRNTWKETVRTGIQENDYLPSQDVDQNREQLIQLRSKNIQEKLDQARQNIETRQNKINSSINP